MEDSVIPQLVFRAQAPDREDAEGRNKKKKNQPVRVAAKRRRLHLNQEYAARANNNAALIGALGSWPFLQVVLFFMEEKVALTWLFVPLTVILTIARWAAQYKFSYRRGYIDKGKQFILVGLTMFASLFSWVTTQLIVALLTDVGKGYAMPSWPTIIYLLIIFIAGFFGLLALWVALYLEEDPGEEDETPERLRP
jgi:hypothetical protein